MGLTVLDVILLVQSYENVGGMHVKSSSQRPNSSKYCNTLLECFAIYSQPIYAYDVCRYKLEAPYLTPDLVKEIINGAEEVKRVVLGNNVDG